MHHATKIAEVIGVPLNQFITINFGVPKGNESEQFSRLRTNYYNKWAKRPRKEVSVVSYTPTYVWVLEAAGGVAAVHWLVHVPEIRLEDFKVRLHTWVGNIANNADIQIKPISNVVGLKRYVLKGIDPTYAQFYGVEHINQGEVLGKRAGFSKNIGPKVKICLRNDGTYPRAKRW